MYDKIIYESSESCIKVDSNNLILYLKTISRVYNQEECDIFINYVTEFWTYVGQNNLRYYLLLDLKESSISIMPMNFYTKLIKSLNDIRNILQEHLNAICILCPENILMKNIIQILFSLYTPDRPLKIIDNEEEMHEFFKSNYIS